MIELIAIMIVQSAMSFSRSHGTHLNSKLMSAEVLQPNLAEKPYHFSQLSEHNFPNESSD